MENTTHIDVLETPIYCIKCTNFTANKDPQIVKRETHHLNALCVKCNCKKNKFLKKKNKIKPDNITELNCESELKSDVVNPDTSEQSDKLS